MYRDILRLLFQVTAVEAVEKLLTINAILWRYI